MADSVRIGFIGCGGNAYGHINSLNKLENAQIVAVCDLVEPLAKKAAEVSGGQAYTDYEKMLERDDLDAMCLSLPVFAHGEPELAIARRGLPFLVEKPVARTMETAKKVLAEVERQEMITCVGYQLRYGAETTAARKILAGQNIGLVVGRYWCGTGRESSDWRGQYDKSGGQILEQATHTLDMMRFLCGEVTRVVALSARRELTDTDCPDVHSIILNFECGAIGSMTTAWACDPRDWSNANIIHITFADRLLRWASGAVTVTGGADSGGALNSGGQNIDEVFVEAVRTGDRSSILSPYRDAVKSLELCLAILESAERGEPVKLDRH